MKNLDRLQTKLALAVMFGLTVLPWHVFAQAVQIFPPEVPGTTTVCPPAGPGYTYTLIWDGQHNVECSQVPTSCPGIPGGESSLVFDGANFKCAVPCSGPSLGFLATGTCPAGEVGQIGVPVTVACDGTETQGAPENTCAATTTVGTISVGPCTVGTVMAGQMQGGFLNTAVCIATPSACSNYVCESGAWAPEP